MKSVDLGDGHSAIVREYNDLKRGDVRKLYKAFDDSGLKPGIAAGYDGGGALVDSALLMLVDSWDLEVPVSLEAIEDLTLPAYEALDKATDDTVRKILNLGEEPDPKSEKPLSPSENADGSQPEA